jgi:1-acyl-sn-glycerol-3-phosphate acyltransferase
MTAIRSVLFVIWLYGAMTAVGIVYAPIACFSRKGALGAGRSWTRLMLFGARWIMGIRVIFKDRHKLPPGPVIVASKHQSMLDTLVPFLLLPDPAFVLKEELLKAPIFGWYAQRMGMIPVAREANAAALRALLKAARPAIEEGRQLFIFPEGTRRPPGEDGDYKPGVAALYKDLGVPVAPIALNSGLCWPAKGLIRKPGTVTIQFLEPIPPGLPRATFMTQLETTIDQASQALLSDRGRP